MSGGQQPGRPPASAGIALPALLAATAIAALEPGSLDDPLWVVLVGAAIVSRLVAVDFGPRLFVSGAFLCGMLAAAFVGPAAAFAVPAAAELVGWAVERYRPIPLLINLGGTTLPTVVAALV